MGRKLFDNLSCGQTLKYKSWPCFETAGVNNNVYLFTVALK